ncbi:M20/M25/M40 family metallo-hydrolase [Dyadobacter tibetensis]|uniref:M20/M25/M40 family metallo-hydrolase n=1 Tax=Dyadobacter tibetensis TaxID=1211851 RepID=UPI00046FF120|nr:M20/M25/M40 family metallo-hydrolase [Dyadobacter tibetensis]
MKTLFTFLLLLSTLHTRAQTFDSLSIRKHISYLASEDLEGRGTGTLGEIRAANYIAASFLASGLKPAGEGSSFFQTFETKIAIESIPHKVLGRNVVGLLDNGSNKTLVIGAHYDHLGKGFQGSSLTPESQNQIHNGADDNASGTAGLLLLAQELAKNGRKEKYNYLFIAFSGEELGLLGSKYFCENPTIALDNIKAMINMDMIGRYLPEKGLMVSGFGSSPSWGKLLPEIVREEQVKLTVDSSGIGASDHTSFYLKGIPVLQFFTGTHSDYHKISDDIEKINYWGESKVLQVITKLLYRLDQGSYDLVYTEAGNPHQNNTRTSFKVTLGVMPDYSFSEKGLKIDAVTKGRPADKAGIRAGDIIIQMGATDIQNIYDYMEVLGAHEVGDRIPVFILRQSKKSEVTIEF